MKKNEILCFAPSKVVDKTVSFMLQGTLINDDDPCVQVLLRLNDETEVLKSLISQYTGLNPDAVSITEDTIIFDVFFEGVNFVAKQVNVNYVKVTIEWYHYTYGVEVMPTDAMKFQKSRKRRVTNR